MESQADIVAAAETLRTWVRGQRASWTAGDVAVMEPRVAIMAPAPQPTLALPVAAPPAPVAAPLPAPAPAAEPSTQSERPAAWPSPSYPGGATVIVAEISIVERTWFRAALAALLILSIGGGYMVMSRRAPDAIGAAAFASTPDGSEVFVDGAPVGRTPVRVELTAGTHTVEFTMNAATRSQKIAVEQGGEVPVMVDWRQKAIGSLQVNSTPTGAKVSVDGKLRGQTPLTLSDLPAGSHTVLIDSSEGAVRRRVQVSEGVTETLTESIYPGWLHVSSPIEVTILDAGKPALLDDSNRVLLKPGAHTVRIENRELAFSQTQRVEIEPGGTTRIAIEVPASTLTVTGSTGAEVFVDGVKAGETPLTEFTVTLGTHDVMVVDRSGVTRHASAKVTTKPLQLEISVERP